MSYPFSFPTYQKNVLLSLYLVSDVTIYKIYVGSTPKAMADRK